MWTSEGKIRIGSMQFGVGAEIETSDPAAVWSVFELMDGTRSRTEVIEAFALARSDIDLESVESLVEAVIAQGFVEDAAAEVPPELSERDIDRYARSTVYYSWVDLVPRSSPWETQRRLKSATVTVLGMGGAGSAAATALVTSGVGHVHCVDFDAVELSNLNRQTLFAEADVGRSKVEAGTNRLRALNSDVVVSGEQRQVRDRRDLEALFATCDLLMLCADKPEPLRLLTWTNETALRIEKPWVMSFYAGPMVVVGLQDPPRTPCYRCLRHVAELNGRIEGDDLRFLLPHLDINAVVAPSAAMAGNLAALEALYFLGDLRPQTLGRLFHMSLTTYDFQYYVEGEPWSRCPACHGVAAGRGLAAVK